MTAPDSPELAETLDVASLPAPRAPEPVEARERGAVVGRYIVVSRLGAGGMGVVYRAYDPELDRKVALKLLHARPGGAGTEAGDEGRARLLREAQAMARLAHPNVIAVHDVGTFEGQVFVAMELVEGGTLGEWLKARPRAAAEVLEVFLQAGRGLAAAHAKGIVHRDFKPDNVLVGADGRVRVLDFGIARALDEGPEAPAEAAVLADSPGQLALAEKLTQTGALFGTPLYMSSEQFRGGPVDARADQFAFCVALYQALYGEHPYDGETFVILVSNVIHGVMRKEPAERRLSPRLRGALLRGLAPQAEARFPNMEALLAELAPEPPRASTRARPWGLAVVLGIVAAGLCASLAWPQRAPVCAGAEEKLRGVWDDDRRRAASAAFAASKLPYAEDARRSTERALDGYAKSWVAAHTDACAATRVRGEQSEELLDLRMECLARRRGELGALTSVLARADAEVVRQSVQAASQLGDLAECADGAALKAAVRPPRDPVIARRVAAVREQLAVVQSLDGAAKYAEELELATPAAAEAASLGYRPLVAEALYGLGVAQFQRGDYKAAEQSLVDAAVAAEASRHDVMAARAWIQLTMVRNARRAFDAAGESGKHAGAMLARLDAPGRLPARLETALGVLAKIEARYDDALDHYRRALSLLEAALGPDHPEVARTLASMAQALGKQGKLDEAIATYRRALLIQEAAYGPVHPDVADTASALSHFLEQQGKYPEALALARRALSIQEGAHAPDHPDIAAALINVGNVLDSLGDADGAIADYARALSIRERSFGPENGLVADVLNNMGEVMSARGKFVEALGYHERALAIREKALPADHPNLAMSLSNIGNALVALLRYREAIPRYERALAITEKTLGPDHLYIADALQGVGASHLGLHEPKVAIAPLTRALAMRRRLGTAPREVAETSLALARALWDGGGDRAQAVALAERAREVFGVNPARDREALAEADAWLAKHR